MGQEYMYMYSKLGGFHCILKLPVWSISSLPSYSHTPPLILPHPTHLLVQWPNSTNCSTCTVIWLFSRTALFLNTFLTLHKQTLPHLNNFGVSIFFKWNCTCCKVIRYAINSCIIIARKHKHILCWHNYKIIISCQLENSPKKICVLIGYKSCFYTCNLMETQNYHKLLT